MPPGRLGRREDLLVCREVHLGCRHRHFGAEPFGEGPDCLAVFEREFRGEFCNRCPLHVALLRDGNAPGVGEDALDARELFHDAQKAHVLSGGALSDGARNVLGKDAGVFFDCLGDAGDRLPGARRRVAASAGVKAAQQLRAKADEGLKLCRNPVRFRPRHPVLKVLRKLKLAHAVGKLRAEAVGPGLVLRPVSGCNDVKLAGKAKLSGAAIKDHAAQRVLHRHVGVRELLDDEHARSNPFAKHPEFLGRQPLGELAVELRQPQNVAWLAQRRVELHNALGCDAVLLGKLLRDFARARALPAAGLSNDEGHHFVGDLKLGEDGRFQIRKFHRVLAIRWCVVRGAPARHALEPPADRPEDGGHELLRRVAHVFRVQAPRAARALAGAAIGGDAAFGEKAGARNEEGDRNLRSEPQLARGAANHVTSPGIRISFEYFDTWIVGIDASMIDACEDASGWANGAGVLDENTENAGRAVEKARPRVRRLV